MQGKKKKKEKILKTNKSIMHGSDGSAKLHDQTNPFYIFLADADVPTLLWHILILSTIGAQLAHPTI